MSSTGIEGRTALVTGAGSGIGRDLTHRLVSLGAQVIAVAQNQSRLDSLKAELGAKVSTVSVNLGNWDETEVKLAPLCKHVDFLINNAGFACVAPADKVPKEGLDQTLDVNLKAPMNLINLVAGGMKERRFGSIVNVSSVASLVALDEHIIYSASKAGLDMVTKICAKELGPYNIRVNSINPTVVWTKMGRDHWSDPQRKATMTAKIPMGRFVEVHEVVEPIVFLLGNGSTMISGITVPIDGGFSAT